MVRFSDMLGGNGDPEGRRATTASASDPAVAPAPEAEDAEHAEDAGDPENGRDAENPDDADATRQTPEAVLDRLTQYASSTRTVDDPVPPAPDAEPPSAPDELTPVGDDLLPRPKGESKKRRRK